MQADFAAGVFRRDRVTWLAYLALGFFSYLEVIPGLLMPFLQAELHLGYAVASLHFGAFSAGVMASGIAGALLIARIGRGRAFWAGAFGMGAGVGLLAWCPSAVGTIAGAALMGLAGTLLLVAVQAILADHHGERRTIAFAESNVVAGVCAILATIAVGSLARTALGWRSSAGLAMVAVAALAVSFRGVPLNNGAGSGISRNAGLTARLSGRFWVFWVVLLLGCAVEWCVVSWGAAYFENAVGFDKATAAGTMSVFFVAVVAGRYLSSRLARRIRSRIILLLAQGLTLLGFPLFWLAPQGALNVVGLFIAGTGIGNLYPMALASAIDTVPHLPEQASARVTLAMGLAGVIAPVALGWLADQFTIRQAYAVVPPLLLAAMALAAVAKEGRR